MKALIYKDLQASLMHGIVLLAQIAMVFLAIRSGIFIISVPAIALLGTSVLNAYTFGMDLQAEIWKFIFSSPTTRKAYVQSKYLIPVFMSLLGFIAILLYGLFDGGSNLGYIVLWALLASFVNLLFASIQLPLIFKAGAKYYNIIYVGSFIFVYSTIHLIGAYKSGLIDFVINLGQKAPWQSSLIIIVATLIILSGSIWLSTRIVKNSEY